VVHVDAAGAGEAVAGQLLVDAGHHLAQGGVALRLLEGVGVAAVVGPGGGDVLGPAGRVLLVPHGQVRLDGRGQVGARQVGGRQIGHGLLLVCVVIGRRVSVPGSTMHLHGRARP
jgi:hypothetical protein